MRSRGEVQEILAGAEEAFCKEADLYIIRKLIH